MYSHKSTPDIRTFIPTIIQTSWKSQGCDICICYIHVHMMSHIIRSLSCDYRSLKLMFFSPSFSCHLINIWHIWTTFLFSVYCQSIARIGMFQLIQLTHMFFGTVLIFFTLFWALISIKVLISSCIHFFAMIAWNDLFLLCLRSVQQICWWLCFTSADKVIF